MSRPCNWSVNRLAYCRTTASPLFSTGSAYARPKDRAGPNCVCNFRGAHQIAVYREGERAERHELILHEAASRLGVSRMTVVRLIRDGVLSARQVCVGAPYVIREDDLDRPSVRRALANGRAVSPDPRQENLSFQ